MGEVINLRVGGAICCVKCQCDKWKVFIDTDETELVQIQKIRCSNCMFELKTVEKKINRGE